MSITITYVGGLPVNITFCSFLSRIFFIFRKFIEKKEERQPNNKEKTKKRTNTSSSMSRERVNEADEVAEETAERQLKSQLQLEDNVGFEVTLTANPSAYEFETDGTNGENHQNRLDEVSGEWPDGFSFVECRDERREQLDVDKQHQVDSSCVPQPLSNSTSYADGPNTANHQ